MSGLYDDYIVLVAGVALQVSASQADFVAHKLLAERVEPVAADGPIAKPDHRAPAAGRQHSWLYQTVIGRFPSLAAPRTARRLCKYLKKNDNIPVA